MRKSCILLSLVFLSAFVACSNAEDTKLSYSDVDTIKALVKDKENQISWTRELEGDLLSESYNLNQDQYDKTITASRLLSKVNNEKNRPVYPEFPDFGLLDTSLLNFSAKETIINFCDALSNDFYTKPQSYFDNSYIFNYVFFRNDFIEDWTNNFSAKFPVKNQNEKKENSPLFTKWILGEPFITSEITQIPVRFYCKHGTVDVTLYLNKKNLIYQISIDRWDRI